MNNDQSFLDNKYFLDKYKYNCPFCNRRSITYSVIDQFSIDWSNEKAVYGYIVKCGGDSCNKVSLHLSNHHFSISNYKFWGTPTREGVEVKNYDSTDLDKYFFYHHPTTFFTMNSLIPGDIRNLISEAEGCKKMGYMVGASGALRKAIYEFLKHQKSEGDSYQDKVKWLKQKYKNLDPNYFDALANIQDMTSSNLHEIEGSWKTWDIKEFDYILESVKTALEEICVIPAKRKERFSKILELKAKIQEKKASTK